MAEPEEVDRSPGVDENSGDDLSVNARELCREPVCGLPGPGS
jgi:hypothetical protein